MFLNSTGEIFESKVSNGKAIFNYNPAETNSNQKVLFSFNREDFACKKSANSKSLDFMLINKTDRENKKAERTFTINKGDVVKPIKFTSLPDKETIEGDAFLDVLEDDDIIRIEAEDGSEEYIEIIFPKDNKDWKDTVIDITTGALDIVFNMPHPLLKSGKFVSKGVKFAAKEIKTVKQLTKAQKKILDIVDKLPSPKKRSKSGKINYGENIRFVKTENDLKNLWKDLAEDIDITQKKIEGKGDIFQGRVNENMIIQYRTFSSKISQNKPTIDINGRTRSTSRKVHIDVSKDNIGDK